MPIYTYRCDNCGVQFDHRQSFTDPQLKLCPECGKKALHKVYTPVGIVFKGSGFYATDNRSPSGQTTKTHSEEKTESSTTESKEPAKAETKPSEGTSSAKSSENASA
jgi:putative FmdB family regulatory protein